jgi:D-alanyl-D-alanine carboxypeptidase
MKNTILPAAFIMLIAVLFFGSCQEKKENPGPSPNQPLTDQLDAWGDSLCTKLTIDSVNLSLQGAIIYVNDPGIGLSYLRAFGTSDLSQTRYLPLKTTDIFRIGSITNTFTATVFLQLAQSGALNLDSHLDMFFPDVPNSENITLRQIANNTSGLFDYSETDTVRHVLNSYPLMVLTPQQLVNFAIENPPYFEPGTGCRYSYTNSVLMGMIIEKITEKSLSENLRTRIFEPLGLDGVTFPVNQFMPFYATYSHGYIYTDIVHQLVDVSERYDPSWAWGSANLIADLPELQTWLPVLVNGTLLNTDIQQQRMQMVDWENIHGIPMQYGLGIMGTSGYFGHTGDYRGYRCIFMYSPATDRTVIIMMNNTSGTPLLMFAQIANLLSPGLIPLTL